jgi:hypothetical protein
VVSVELPFHPTSGSGREADPLSGLDDVGQEIHMVWPERAHEKMKNTKVIPQDPSRACASGGDGFEFASDVTHCAFGPADPAGRRHTQDVSTFQSGHQLSGKAPCSVGLFGLFGDEVQEWFDEQAFGGGVQEQGNWIGWR